MRIVVVITKCNTCGVISKIIHVMESCYIKHAICTDSCYLTSMYGQLLYYLKLYHMYGEFYLKINISGRLLYQTKS